MFEKHKNTLSFSAVVLTLFGLTWLIYSSALHYGFQFFDDTIYILQDPRVIGGFSPVNLTNILVGVYDLNWHPLTTFSFLLSYELHGFHAGKFLLPNLLGHGLNGVLVFILLRTFSKSFWKSFAVALLFIVHPMHVESVAWITERKDVFSTTCGLLSGIAYSYSRLKDIRAYQLLCFLFFVMSLLFKPMLVTLPVIFVLMDIGPLQVVKSFKDFALSIFQKWFYWVIAIVVIWIAYQAQTINHAIISYEALSLKERLLSISIHYANYIYRTLYPISLGIFYQPYTHEFVHTYWIPSLVLILWITGAAIVSRRDIPFFCFSWFLFLVALLPVIGIIKAGPQPIADRYTYFAHIGFFIICVFFLARILKLLRVRKFLFIVLMFVTVAGLTVRAKKQVSYWSDSGRLVEHTLSFEPDNEIALRKVGKYYQMVAKDYDRAVGLFGKALSMQPDDAALLLNVMDLSMKSGNYLQVISIGNAYLFQHDKYAHPYWMMGKSAEELGDTESAKDFYERAYQINPEHAPTAEALDRLS